MGNGNIKQTSIKMPLFCKKCHKRAGKDGCTHYVDIDSLIPPAQKPAPAVVAPYAPKPSVTPIPPHMAAFHAELGHLFNEQHLLPILYNFANPARMPSPLSKPLIDALTSVYENPLIALDPAFFPRSINALAVSLDGLLIAAGEGDTHPGKIYVWDIQSGRLRTRAFVADTGGASFFGGERGGKVASLAFSPNSQYLAVAGWDHSIFLWDLTTSEQVHCFASAFQVRSLSFNHDSSMILSRNADHTVQCWDVEMKASKKDSFWRGISSAAFSPLDNRRIFGLPHGGVEADIHRFSELPSHHTGSVNCVAFSPRGHFIISGGADKTVRVWDARTAEQLHCFVFEANISKVAFDLNENLILAGSAAGLIKVWDAKTGKPLCSLKSRPQDAPTYNGLTFSADGTHALWWTHSGKIKIQNIMVDSIPFAAASSPALASPAASSAAGICQHQNLSPSSRPGYSFCADCYAPIPFEQACHILDIGMNRVPRLTHIGQPTTITESDHTLSGEKFNMRTGLGRIKNRHGFGENIYKCYFCGQTFAGEKGTITRFIP